MSKYSMADYAAKAREAVAEGIVLLRNENGVLPLAARALHADPVIMASPLITTIVDALSLVIYFSIAQRLLPI